MANLNKNRHWPCPVRSRTLSVVSGFSPGLFLVISLMSLKLWTLTDVAGPIVLILLIQVVSVSLFAAFVVFRVLGKEFDAAVISAGYVGLALGAMPTAIANMTAVSKKFGPSPVAFLVVPLVGVFFIDISNAIIIQSILTWLG